ncbi:MAG TPA: lipase family protein, partial [Xanthomonadales bacterium]|nr:lipase family protein [Xanthomonadales bacterium]
MNRCFAALAAAVSLIATGVPAGTLASPSAGPNGAAFYVPPAPLAPGRHGDVIWARPLTTAAALPHAAENSLVLYHTTSVDGRDVAVSGTVAVPSGPMPANGWPVISWAHGTTGDAPSCTPSLDDATAPEHWYLGPVNALLDGYVQRGYAVVQTDYEGQGTPGVHPYLVGVAEGRDVVDMVRAARGVNPRVGRRFVVMGHSQGGQSALFAASLAPAWAPELQLLGGVALAPASHLGPWLRGLTTRQEPYLGFGFAALLIRGYASIDPAVRADRLLSDAAMPLQSQLTDRCVLGLIKPDSWAGLPPAKAFRADADLAPLLRQADANEPGSLAYGVPVLMLQGTADTTVSPASTDLVRGELCAKAAALTYRAMPGATHNGMLPDSFAIVQPWIDARFAG